MVLCDLLAAIKHSSESNFAHNATAQYEEFIDINKEKNKGIWFASLTTLHPMHDKELLFNQATQVISDR